MRLMTQHSESLRQEREIQISSTSLLLDLHILFLNVLNTQKQNHKNTEHAVSHQREMF